MFIEFSVSNYRSFREKQTISFAATSSTEHRKTHTFSPQQKGVPDLLKWIAVYGPNAAGKSNLIKAILFFKELVLHSSKSRQLNEPLKVPCFKFDHEERFLPSEFELIFAHQEIRYQYGCAIKVGKIQEEWLFAFPEGRRQHWFNRNWDESRRGYEWYFGPKFKGSKSLWSEATRENALFLSTAVQLNSQVLKPVYEWFEQSLKVVPPDSRFSPVYTAEACEDDNKQEIIKFLNAADLGIHDIAIQREQISEEDIPDDLPDNLKKRLLSSAGKLKIEFFHRGEGRSTLIPINFREESRGTQKIFEMARSWLEFLERGSTLIIDELDKSLHIQIAYFLFNLIKNKNRNPKNGQLLFTTHNTSLMDLKIFRRDQIWFLEKEADLASQLYSLSDFSPQPRKNEDIEKGYLKGRYGALPFVKEPVG